MSNLLQYQQTAKALGTNIELRLVMNSRERAEHLFYMLWNYISDYDQRFSRFIDESELNKVNYNAGKNVSVSDQMIKLAKKSLRLSEVSEGLFNPFVLPAVQRLGYINSLHPNGRDLKSINFSTRDFANYEEMIVGDDTISIPSNTAIDFGGIGKGYLAGELAKIADVETKNYLFSIGGDIVASGRREDNQEWNILVQSPFDFKEDGALYRQEQPKIFLATSGLARTKGSYTQEHIINPSSQKVVQGNLVMCSVVSEDGATSDVLASCILIGGKAFAEKMIKSNKIYGALLQYKNKQVVKFGNGFDVQYKHKQGEHA